MKKAVFKIGEKPLRVTYSEKRLPRIAVLKDGRTVALTWTKNDSGWEITHAVIWPHAMAEEVS